MFISKVYLFLFSSAKNQFFDNLTRSAFPPRPLSYLTWGAVECVMGLQVLMTV